MASGSHSSPEAKQKFIQINDAYETLVEGKQHYTYKTSDQAHSQPKTSREREDERLEKSRERIRHHTELKKEQFAKMRYEFKNASDSDLRKRKLFFTAYFNFIVGTILVLLPIVAGIIAKESAKSVGIIILLGAFCIRASIPYFISGKRKLKKREMIFGEKENYSLKELEENIFFDEK